MINSFFYFFKFVFILKDDNRFRLVIIQENRKSLDRKYKTIKGAKIACAKWLSLVSGSPEVKPVWSFLYPPDESWLQDKLNRKRVAAAKRPAAATYMKHTLSAHI